MKFKIAQNQLAKCISIVQKGVSSKSTLPVLQGILIEALHDRIELTGTDLELGIKSSVECEVEEIGSIVIASRIFGDIIKKLPNEDIEIEVDSNNKVHITCQNSKFNIMGQSSVEYPQLPEISNEISIGLPKDVLKNMIRQTVFATAQNETKPILTGALLEAKEGVVSLVALDGYRLALRRMNIDVESDIKVVIPGKTLNEVNKILEDDDSEVRLMFTPSHVLFDLGKTVVISRLLEGQFINYEDIIRSEHNSKIRVNTKELQRSIERAALLARDEKNSLIKLEINDEDIIISSNSDIGDVSEKITIELQGEELKIGFSSKYMLDGLKSIDAEEVDMTFVSSMTPCIIRPVEDEDYIYLIVPVRMAE